MYYKGKKYDLTLHDVVSKDKSKALRTLSPDYYRDMPDRIWETHEVAVGILNSLNAICPLPQYKRDRGLMEKTQEVIRALLYETGRMEEYEKWIYERYEYKKVEE